MQPIAGVFQCCSCCGQPGRKRPTCSCHKKTRKNHQCLKFIQKEHEQQERRSTRKWIYFAFAMLQMPEKQELEEEEDEEAEAEWKVIDCKQ